MKRFVVALVLLVLAISMSIGAQVVFFARTQELTDSMNGLLTAIDSGDENVTAQKLDTVMKSWARSKKVLHMILVHRSMDEIEININGLGEFLKAGDTEALRQSCTEALRQLENLRDANRLSAENIF